MPLQASFAAKSVLKAQPSHHSFERVYVLKRRGLTVWLRYALQLKVCCAGPAIGGPCCCGIKWCGCGMSEGDACLSKCELYLGNNFWITMGAVI